MQLNKLIADCSEEKCPLYSKFFDQPNAQSEYRKEYFKWAMKRRPNKIIRESQEYGAKLLLIMESPPPKFNEYFYGDEGGFKKKCGLFRSVVRAYLEVEPKPDIIDWEDTKEAISLMQDKSFWLDWLKEKGFFLIDAAKCRLKLSDPIITDPVKGLEKTNTFISCSQILKQEILEINPFRIIIGIKGLYEEGIVQNVLDELNLSERFITKKIRSPFHNNEEEFVREFSKVWRQVKQEFEMN